MKNKLLNNLNPFTDSIENPFNISKNNIRYVYYYFTGFQNNNPINTFINEIYNLGFEIEVTTSTKSIDYHTMVQELEKKSLNTKFRKKRLFDKDIEPENKNNLKKFDEYNKEIYIIESTKSEIQESKENSINFALFVKFTLYKKDFNKSLNELKNILESVCHSSKINMSLAYGKQLEIYKQSKGIKKIDNVVSYNILPETLDYFNQFKIQSRQLIKQEDRTLFLGYDDNLIPVWNKINYTIHKASNFGILGTSGSGKTTLLKSMIHQFLKQGNSRVIIAGDFEKQFDDISSQYDSLDIDISKSGCDIFNFDTEDVSIIQKILLIVLENSIEDKLPYQQRQELLNILSEIKKIKETESLDSVGCLKLFYEKLEKSNKELEGLYKYSEYLKQNKAFEILTRKSDINLLNIKQQIIRFNCESNDSSFPVLLAILENMIYKPPFDIAIPSMLIFDEFSEFLKSNSTINENRADCISSIFARCRKRNVKASFADQYPERFSGNALNSIIGNCNEFYLAPHHRLECFKDIIEEETYNKILQIKNQNNLLTRKFYHYKKDENKGIFVNIFVPKTFMKK